MLIPEKAPGNIKWKTVEETNSLYYAEDTKGDLHHLSWDTFVSSEKWKGNCPYTADNSLPSLLYFVYGSSKFNPSGQF